MIIFTIGVCATTSLMNRANRFVGFDPVLCKILVFIRELPQRSLQATTW
jgi:hypothetical protein